MPNLSQSLVKRRYSETISASARSPNHTSACPAINVTCTAKRWTPHSHGTFSSTGRARAVELHRLGVLLAKAMRPDGEETMAFVDVWQESIMPLAIAFDDLDCDDRVSAVLCTGSAVRPMIRPRCVSLVCSDQEW